MITNDPNTNLIEAMKEKLPLKGKLADMLMDTLYIGSFHFTRSGSRFEKVRDISG